MYLFGTLISPASPQSSLNTCFISLCVSSNSGLHCLCATRYHHVLLFACALQFPVYLFLSIDRIVTAVATAYDGIQASRHGTKPLLPDSARLNIKTGFTIKDILSYDNVLLDRSVPMFRREIMLPYVD